MANPDKLRFIPTKLSFISLSLTSACLLFFINVEQIISLIFTNKEINIYNHSLESIRSFFLNKLSEITVDVGTYLFWLIAGFACLLLFDLLRWLLYLYRSDVPQIDQANQTHDGYGKAIKNMWLRVSVRSTAMLGLVGWLVLLFTYILPYCSTLFLSGLEWSLDIYGVPVSSVVLGLYVYLVSILLRFLVLRRHL